VVGGDGAGNSDAHDVDLLSRFGGPVFAAGPSRTSGAKPGKATASPRPDMADARARSIPGHGHPSSIFSLEAQ
jgi:hypothetical protein